MSQSRLLHIARCDNEILCRWLTKEGYPKYIVIDSGSGEPVRGIATYGRAKEWLMADGTISDEDAHVCLKDAETRAKEMSRRIPSAPSLAPDTTRDDRVAGP